jgi:hypothetical protein
MARAYGRTDDFAAHTMNCIVCTSPMPPTRRKDAVTCSPACSSIRAKWLRSLIDQTRCRYCQRPSTPAERAAFNRWRKWEAQQAAAAQKDESPAEGDTSVLASLTNSEKEEHSDDGRP